MVIGLQKVVYFYVQLIVGHLFININDLYFSSIQNNTKPTIIVSIFGKSSLVSKSCKARFVNDFYDRPIFNSSLVQATSNSKLQVTNC